MQAAVTKHHQLGDNTCSHSSGGWKAKIKVLVDSESGEARFLVHRRLSSHCVLTWQWGLGALWSFLHKGMNHVFAALLVGKVLLNLFGNPITAKE